jgi:hypothetical protein
MDGWSEGRVTLTFCFSLCSCDGSKQARPLMICGVGFVRFDGCGVPDVGRWSRFLQSLLTVEVATGF